MLAALAHGVVPLLQLAIGQPVHARGTPQLPACDELRAGGVLVNRARQVARQFDLAGGVTVREGGAELDGVDGKAVFRQDVAVGEQPDEILPSEVFSTRLYRAAFASWRALNASWRLCS